MRLRLKVVWPPDDFAEKHEGVRSERLKRNTKSATRRATGDGLYLSWGEMM